MDLHSGEAADLRVEVTRLKEQVRWLKAEAEAANAEAGRELRQLIETSNAPIFGVDRDLRVNEWNLKTVEITGFTKDEAMDKPLVEGFITSHLKDHVNAVLQRALAGSNTANYELAFATKSGDMRLLLVNATTRRNMDGAVIGVVGVAQDVTESKRLEQQFRKETCELRSLIATANAPIFGVDRDLRVNEWNLKTVEITGFTKEEAMGKPLVEGFITSHLMDSVSIVLQRALAGSNTANYELAFATKSGDVRLLLVNATTRRNMDGAVIGVVGVAQDVTESKRLEQQLTKEVFEWRNLIDTANAPIFGVDRDLCVNEWNQKAERVTGYKKSEVMGQLFVTFVEASTRASVAAVLSNALRGVETSQYELRVVAKSGAVRIVIMNATSRRSLKWSHASDKAANMVARFDPVLEISGVVGVGQDVSSSASTGSSSAAKSRAHSSKQRGGSPSSLHQPRSALSQHCDDGGGGGSRSHQHRRQFADLFLQPVQTRSELARIKTPGPFLLPMNSKTAARFTPAAVAASTGPAASISLGGLAAGAVTPTPLPAWGTRSDGRTLRPPTCRSDAPNTPTQRTHGGGGMPFSSAKRLGKISTLGGSFSAPLPSVEDLDLQ